MAERKHKFDQNIAGHFFVDDQCIACDACVAEAPLFFAMNDEEGHAYVKAQPQKQAEIDLCNEALELCPVEAIGNQKNP